jgi:hypothetical protein
MRLIHVNTAKNARPKLEDRRLSSITNTLKRPSSSSSNQPSTRIFYFFTLMLENSRRVTAFETVHRLLSQKSSLTSPTSHLPPPGFCAHSNSNMTIGFTRLMCETLLEYEQISALN